MYSDICVASDVCVHNSKSLTYRLLNKEDKFFKELIINSVETFEEAFTNHSCFTGRIQQIYSGTGRYYL